MSTFQIGGVKPRIVSDEITIGDAGAEMIVRLLTQEGKSPAQYALRIAVLGGGCSGFRYDMRWEEPRAEDHIVTHENGARVCVDPRSKQMLAGSRVEYVSKLQGAGFSIVNPNATGTCGCGESFSA